MEGDPKTRPTADCPDEAAASLRRDQQLDQALEDTFPASDPVTQLRID
jgi:hypothetical protein